MIEVIKFGIGIVFLFLGFLLGNLLAKLTKEELKDGKKWFKLIIIFGFLGAIVSLILKNDVLFFSFLFFVIVTSRSLKYKSL